MEINLIMHLAKARGRQSCMRLLGGEEIWYIRSLMPRRTDMGFKFDRHWRDHSLAIGRTQNQAANESRSISRQGRFQNRGG